MFATTDRTAASRYRERIDRRQEPAHDLLDEAYHCVLGFTVDGEPRLLPTLHVRIGDTLYLHGSTGSRPLLAARAEPGLPVCVAVTQLDGLVYARSQFHHSANYRSAVVHGVARLVAEEETKRRVLAALVDKVGPGRAADTRPPTRRELAETAVLALPLHEVTVKRRSGAPVDDEADLDLPYWAGVLPLRQVAGVPEPAAGVTVPVPEYLRPVTSPWLSAEPMRGDHVALEPLDASHTEALYAAGADEEVWRHLGSATPDGPADVAGWVTAALRAQLAGERVPWVQRCARTGTVLGSTSFYEVDPERRSLAIGYTWLGRPWWRTGVNTEAKLLLLDRAFGALGAVRVVWHTDIRNERSQRAIERLGARREGVLRMHKQRADGSWRDTVQYAMTEQDWPDARRLLRDRIRPAASAA
ncbi:bifunctional pyridoxamine 5'-phosphate oxidase family protein/GNAT family N-acetyltransferase [Plantactinospora sp. GCM10030261]|uniref:bifunctional pyridoxamine 5'-phosphate oxidase family protein/GNAT family N-acetyltransferase n=1 Tax=Plantactinospora sp. GCM10030261 TaxID=3273420 RepID=UPI00361DCF50